ncbi:MAG: extracellular solute-binding protein [Firmicutes bacterium]|nr:extracellular solute-binding protein [Bacillota bacterium]
MSTKKTTLARIGHVLYLALIVLFLYLPIGTLMVLSFNDGKSMSAWQGFSLKWYQEMFQNKEILEALGNTLSIALWSATAATVIGVLACIGLNAMGEKKRSFFMGLNNIPLLNADIVTGISIMMMFLMFGISLNLGTVMFAHITFCIPYVILSVMPKFRQLQNLTYEAALDLGATPVYAFFKIVLPDIMPGVVSGFLLAFTMSVDDFVITHFTRGAGINTLSTLIYSQVKVGIRPTLYALSTVIFVTVLVVLAAANIMGSRSKGGSSGGSMSSRKIIALGLCLCLMLGFSAKISFFKGAAAAGDTRGELYIYCFGDYLDPDLIEEFEERTGYAVVMDYFDTNEEMYPVVKNQTAQYDIICASDYMINKMAGEGLLDAIDFRYVPNAQYLQENVRAFVDEFDPGMEHCLPHTWGTYGIIYNTELMDEVPDSWEILWDEDYAQQLMMPNSIRECYMIAGKILGYSMNTTSEAELAEMTELLIEQKPLVYSYANDNARDLMVGESAAMAVIASGDVLYAQEENEALDFTVPKEGTEVWTDCWAIPQGAGNLEGAHAWLNFMYEEKSARLNFEYLTYAIPNTQILDLTDNPILNPGDEILFRCETLHNLGPKADDMYSRFWKEFKSQ